MFIMLTDSTLAAAALITALGGLALVVAVLLPILRTTKQVHTIVNQQRTDAMNFQRALIRALTDAGVDVPIDQSLPVAGDESPS